MSTVNSYHCKKYSGHLPSRSLSVVNSATGKVVKVKGHVYRKGKHVVEVVSGFLYRSVFTNYSNTLKSAEPDYVVTSTTNPDVGVLQSKEWFDWDDEPKSLTPGLPLIFAFSLRFPSKTILPSTSPPSLWRYSFADDAHGNPVLSYLQRHGSPKGQTVPLANEGYKLTIEGTTSFFSPLTNEPHSGVSGDFNPIHINLYFSCYAGLPETITHN
ncbi:hypothetical protein BDP27DRAFT_1430374 [Rhodocollybia butyracea]|uniref:Uncharacterized protein n=1 Tax=Rhodocollybia butyracea TaxID=206335 RepID=A0A9P5P4R2_9AGAR|nr:hypothetical protein BDP27DRAFT_1437964 [Rhodocollybia butyracea]KAF9060222.1 hypothetical protein BDP27DRAFT_1430374 [Rhodocollybia butyracea]